MNETVDTPEKTKLLPAGHERKLLEDPAHAAPPRRIRAILIGLVLLLVLGGLFLAGYLPRLKREKGINREAENQEASLPIVNVVTAKRSPANSELQLPGNINPLTEAFIYARASGYVKRRFADIGDRVRAGQVLALIEAPDLDQQVAQARASLAQSRASLGQTQAALAQTQSQLRLAAVTLSRWNTLVSRGVLAKQEGDQKQADYDNAQANVHAAEANVKASQEAVRASEANVNRLLELQGFKQIRAPFAGVITARNVDVGALISPTGSSQGSNTGSSAAGSQGGEMFRMAQIGVLRVMVNVPQSDSAGIRLGQPAYATVNEYPGRRFAGKVTRTSNSFDPTSRTLLTEVQVANPNQVLLPGMYAQVLFENARVNPPLIVPGDSIAVRTSGPQAAILVAGNKVHFQSVTVGRDFGTDTEILSGLNDGDVVIVNPSDDVREGAHVKPVRTSPPKAIPGSAPNAPSRKASN